MKPANEKKLLAVVYWTVFALAGLFMLYSSHATCTSVLAPAHKYCAD